MGDDALIRERNLGIVLQCLEAVSNHDGARLAEFFADKVQVRVPYALGDLLDGLLSGAVSYPELVSSMAPVFEPHGFHDFRLSTLLNPDEVVAEYRGDGRVKATGRPYRNVYLTRATLRTGG